ILGVLFNVKHLIPYHGDSSDDDLAMNSRTNFDYLGGNDRGPSIEERTNFSIPAIISIIRVIPAEVPIIPTDPLVVPEVGAVSVTSPAGVLDLVDYSSSSDSDLSEDSLPLAPELPLVSPFLYSDDLEADSESEPAEQRPERHESLAVHDAMILRWRVHHHLSFPLPLLLPHPGFFDGQRFLSDPVRLLLSVDLTAPIQIGRVSC
ncbi:hypothetical protein Tco_0664108, partial [Tanacetum coccineum]